MVGFKTTKIETEEVVDTNPITWLNAGIKFIKDKEYKVAIKNFEGAIKYDVGKTEVSDKAWLLTVLCYYYLGNVTLARKKQRESTNFVWYLYERPDMMVILLDYDKSYWNNIWKEIIIKKYKAHNNDFFIKYSEYIDDKILELCRILDNRNNDLINRPGLSKEMREYLENT